MCTSRVHELTAYLSSPLKRGFYPVLEWISLNNWFKRKKKNVAGLFCPWHFPLSFCISLCSIWSRAFFSDTVEVQRGCTIANIIYRREKKDYRIFRKQHIKAAHWAPCLMPLVPLCQVLHRGDLHHSPLFCSKFLPLFPACKDNG